MPSVGDWLQRARSFLTKELWHFEPERRPLRLVTRTLQFFMMVGEGFVRDQLLLRASALTYFAVLAIVPVLVIATAVLTAFGVTENVVGPVIDQFAEVVPEFAATLRQILDNASIGALGTIGAVALLATTVLGISNVEQALNHIWGVQHQRPLASRFVWYFALIVVSPLLLGVGISVSSLVADQGIVTYMLQFPLFEAAYDLGLRQVPTLIFAVSFTLLYFFLPNTNVAFGAAALGGLFSALAFRAATEAYVGFAVGAARADALYGGFAALPLVFFWIYTVWAILLLGAEMAFAYQNLASYRREVRSRNASQSEREALALHLSVAVARRFRDGDAPLDNQTASELLDAPVRVIREVEARLSGGGILARLQLSDESEGLTPARPLDQIRVADVLAAMRGERDPEGLPGGLDRLVESVLSELDEATEKGAGARSLAELLEAGPAVRDALPGASS